jgi:type IX secretion system PorP/SprF family membrane protein
MKSLSIISCLFLFTTSITAQDRVVVPVGLHQFYQHLDIVNPAATAYHYSKKAIIGNKSLDGIFKEVQTNFAGANIRLHSNDSTQQDAHGIGLTMLTSKEGPYISRSRFYASYAWHNSIRRNWLLSMGIMAGFIHYRYKETDIYPSQSAMRFTSDIGILLYQPKKIAIGLSLNQYIRSNMAPVEPGLVIKPYATFIVDFTVPISYTLDWRNSFIGRVPIQKKTVDADLTSTLTIQKIVVAGLHYKIHKGYSFIVGLESGLNRKNGVNLFFSYYNPFLFKDNILVPEAELTLVFFTY